MDMAMGRGIQMLAYSGSFPFTVKSTDRTPFTRSNGSWLVKKGLGSAPNHHRVVVVQAQDRPTWLPGLDPPPYLDGT